jgi:hypothetical protein
MSSTEVDVTRAAGAKTIAWPVYVLNVDVRRTSEHNRPNLYTDPKSDDLLKAFVADMSRYVVLQMIPPRRR